MATRDEVIEIVAAGHAIAGTLIVPDTRMPGVLFLHGWGGDQAQYALRAREIAALGCACLTIDMRGHAKTAPVYATVTREDNLRDALAAYDRLAHEVDVDNGQIAVIGSSYGGYLATILTAMRPVKWLALRAPALYRDTDWTSPKLALRQLQGLEAYRQMVIEARDNRALRAATEFVGDVLIVEGEHDTIIPHEVIENYRNAFVGARSLTFRVIDGADHGLTDPAWRQAYTTLLVNWITEMIAGNRDVDSSSQKRHQEVMKTRGTARTG
jgi:uncharacterized protein